jgi:hypothetical protein
VVAPSAPALPRQTSTPTLEQIQADPSVKDFALAFAPADAKSLVHSIFERSRAAGVPLIMRIDAPVERHPLFNRTYDHHADVHSAPASSLCATLYCRPLPRGKERDEHEAPPQVFAVVQLRNKQWSDDPAAQPSMFGPMDVALFERCSMLIGSTLRQGLVAERSRFLQAYTLAAEERTQAIMRLLRLIGSAGLHEGVLFESVPSQVVRILRCANAVLWLMTDDGKKVFTFSAANVGMVAGAAIAAEGMGDGQLPATGASGEVRQELLMARPSLVTASLAAREMIDLRDAYFDARFDQVRVLAGERALPHASERVRTGCKRACASYK